MIRIILAGTAAFALAASASAAPKAATTAKPVVTKAVQCKDAKGKFIKCPAPVAKAVAKSPVAVAEKKTTGAKAAPAKRCRDAKGRFAKCGTPGAK